MGLLNKVKSKAKARIEKPNNELSIPELQFLLKLISNSAFQGKDIQLLYDLTKKLQQQSMG